MNKQLSTIKKIRSDKLSKIWIFIFSSFSIIALFLVIIFILRQSFPAIQHYGFIDIFFKADFSPAKSSYGVWGPLLITLITASFSVLIGIYISIRLAIFIFYRLGRVQKIIKFLVELLATIPSVIFGIFASRSLGILLQDITNSSTPNTILTAIFMLTLMIIPLMTSLIYNQLKHSDVDLLKTSIGLGNTKTFSIYHVVKKSLRPGIIVASMLAFGRAIGETMAVSILLSGSTSNPFSSGFGAFFNSSWNTLGGNIAYWMTSDSTDQYLKSALYAAGIVLFLVIMIINIFVLNVSKKKTFTKQPTKFVYSISSLQTPLDYLKFSWWIIKYPFMCVWWCFMKIIDLFSISYDFLAYYTTNATVILFNPSKRNSSANQKYFYKQANDFRKIIWDKLRVLLEIFFTGFILLILGWITITIFIKGGSYFTFDHLFTTRKDSLGSSLLVTLLLIFTTIVVGVPFAMCGAIYLSEYSNSKQKFAKILRFFLDSLGGTPSIIFGMFGLIFFLQTLHFASGELWKTGSIIAGSLTMFIVILPSLTRVIEQSLSNIPLTLRYASLALGASKWETIKKIVIPNAIQGIISGVIFSIGRIMSETAPIYLTAGLLPHKVGLLFPGQTLTSRILYCAIYSPYPPSQAEGMAYEAALVTFLLVVIIALFATYWYEIYSWFKFVYNNAFDMIKRRKHCALKKEGISNG